MNWLCWLAMVQQCSRLLGPLLQRLLLFLLLLLRLAHPAITVKRGRQATHGWVGHDDLRVPTDWSQVPGIQV